MKVGYVQNSPVFGEKEKNFKQIERVLHNIKADLIVLPELFATGYTFIDKEEALNLAETADGITSDFLKELSRKSSAIIIAGFAELSGDKIYNSAIILKEQKIMGVYRKIHLYYKEKLWFSPGNRAFEVFEIDSVKIGVMICFDWIFPESARSLSLLGADIIAHPANLVLPFCQKAMVTRCLENGVFAITANRIGTEERGDDIFSFTGASQITSFNGDILASAPNNELAVDIVDIDVNNARNKSLNNINNLFADRKKELYYL
ncbi:MAG: nitrilase-related carbon-nitrogen hydrolase [Promethearchaeota archaeon]